VIELFCNDSGVALEFGIDNVAVLKRFLRLVHSVEMCVLAHVDVLFNRIRCTVRWLVILDLPAISLHQRFAGYVMHEAGRNQNLRRDVSEWAGT